MTRYAEAYKMKPLETVHSFREYKTQLIEYAE